MKHAPTAHKLFPRIESHPPQFGAFDVFVWTIAVLGVIAFVWLVTGCDSSEIDQQIAQGQRQAKLEAAKPTTRAVVDVAKIEAKNKTDVAKAKADAKLADVAPSSHPIASTNQTVKRLRVPFEIAAVAGGVLFALFLGLMFTPLSFVSKIGLPLSAALGLCGLFTSIALPWIPWLIAAAGVLALVAVVYECIKHRSIKAGVQAVITDIETELYGLSGSTPPAAPASSSTSSTWDVSSTIKLVGGEISSVEAAAKNEMATALAKVKSLLRIKTTSAAVPANAGTKSAPLVIPPATKTS